MLLHDYLEYYAREVPDNLFAEMEQQRTTYGDANRWANRLAHGLVELGLKPGDRVAYLSKNSIDMALTYYGASKVGVVPVPLNYRLAAPEWKYIIDDCQAKVLIAEAEYMEAIDGIRSELSRITDYIGITSDPLEGWQSSDNWLESQKDVNPDISISDNQQLYQMYTSGTTGLPKGAMLSQSAVDANVSMLSAMFHMVAGEDRFLVVAPMYHAAAGIGMMTTVSQGGTLVVQKEFDPAEVIRSLAEDGISMALLVPAMIQACLVAVPDVAERSYPDLHTLIYGASPIAEEVLRAAMGVFGCDFYQGFGLTETTAASTGLTAADHQLGFTEKPELLLSAGRALLGTRIKIVDEDGSELPNETVGEIAIKGPQLMSGYWNLPEATEEALRDGWFYSGDAGKMDDDGYLYIQDRIKDMIVSGGENVYPREIENTLFEHPAVADAAVVGIPSEQWGEAILAFIVVKPGQSVSTDEIIEFCRERMAGYKIPRKVEFSEVLPRNASGKVLKKDLREPYWAGVDRRVG